MDLVGGRDVAVARDVERETWTRQHEVRPGDGVEPQLVSDGRGDRQSVPEQLELEDLQRRVVEPGVRRHQLLPQRLEPEHLAHEETVAELAQAEAALLQAIANADAADANAALAERAAVGNKSASRATLAGSVVGEKTSAEQLNEGHAQLSSADAQLTQAREDAERARALVKSNAMSKAQLDQTETRLRLADSNLQLARARIETLKSSVVAARSRVDEASARAAQNSDVSSSVKQARAQADAAKAQVKVSIALRDLAALDLSYTKILAPMSGVVSKKSVTVGQGVAAGQSMVALVPDEMWVTANFKETQIGAMRTGQPVKIEVDAFPGKKLEGHVESLSGGTGSRFALLPPDNASGNFTKVVQRLPVRIKIDHAPEGLPLRTGLNAFLTVDTRVQPTTR